MTTQPRAGNAEQLPRRCRLLAHRGVYKPDGDTALLLRALDHEPFDPRTAVLDLGTGSGALALAAARYGARVTAVDISWRAVWTTRLNALLNGAAVTVRRGDLGAVPDLGTFGLVLSNPPHVPSSGSLPLRGAALAWEGGLAGRTVVDRVCAAARALRPDCTLLMVHSALCGEDESLEHLDGLGMKAAVIDRTFVPFGPVMRARRSWLRTQGLLGREATMEELVVIRAPNSSERPHRITVDREGPLLVEGPVEVTDGEGEVHESHRFQVAICTCRRSRTFPWCDTSHRRKATQEPAPAAGPRRRRGDMAPTHLTPPPRPPESRTRQPELPVPRGDLSSQVIAALCDGGPPDTLAQQRGITAARPYGEDLQLALYVLYELHYQGFEGVDPELEWEPGLLALRRLLEQHFLAALRLDAAPQTDAAQAPADVQIEPASYQASSVSHCLGAAPAAALATVTVMSLFGLHRGLRGALVGHFATVEITSSPGSRHLANALRRLDAGPAAQRFYDEHDEYVEADAVHEQVVRHEVVDGLLRAEPFLDGDVVFGVSATGFLEGRLGERLLTRWRQGRSALLHPLPDTNTPPQGDTS